MIKTTLFHRPILAVLITCWLALFTQSAVAADTNFRYAFFAPSTTFPAQMMKHWKKEVEQQTNGAVKARLYMGGSLLGANDMYDGVLSGVADIGLGVMTYDKSRFPLVYGISLPLSFPNATVASETLRQLLQEFHPKGLEKFKIITVYTTMPAHIMSRKPIRSVADLKDAKITAFASNMDALKKLGASPISMPMSDVPQAVQTGVTDGIMSSFEILRDLRLADQLKYVTDYPFGVYAHAALMSKREWNKLPASTQKVINNLAPKTSEWVGKFHDADTQKALSWAEKNEGVKVVTLSDAEKKKWDNALDSITQQWLDLHKDDDVPAAAFLKRALELKAKYIAAQNKAQ